MGNLPEHGVTGSDPFLHTRVYYAGPVQKRVSIGQGNKSYKGKVIHLEAVSDMTTIVQP